MLKSLLIILCTLCALGRITMASAEQDKTAGVIEPQDVADCLTNSLDTSIYCRGSRAINNVLNNLNRDTKPLVLLPGLEIVPAKEQSVSLKVDELEDNSFLGKFAKYLRTHELNLKFADLLTDESENHVARDWERLGGSFGSLYEARKKDRGQGMILVVVAMFAKMMAAMGMGGIGMLAMKALGVASAALALAALVGIKSMAQHGHESSHSVQYIPAEGHHHLRRRRRRSLNKLFTAMPLAYRE